MIRCNIIFIFLLAGCAISMQNNINHTSTQSKKSVVWFDSEGHYFSGDIISYLNKVKSGELIDPELLLAVEKVVKKNEPVEYKDLSAIASVLDPLEATAAIYLSDNEIIQNQYQEILEHFNQSLTEYGNLTVRYFGVQPQGEVNQLEGTSLTNGFLALPADPKIMTGATLEKDEFGVSRLEDNLLIGSEKPTWKDFAVQLIPTADGRLRVSNLHPGPWILYQNQYGIMAFCYRIQIQAGEDHELIADKLLWSPQLVNNTKEN